MIITALIVSGIYLWSGIVFATALWILWKMKILHDDGSEMKSGWALQWIVLWPLLPLFVIVSIHDEWRNRE